MVWSVPKTWIAGTVVTEGHLNAHIRDNLNATMPGKATSAGQFFVTDALNVLATRTISASTIATSEETSATTYDDLATLGPSVTVTSGTMALCLFSTIMDAFGLFGGAAEARATVVSSDFWWETIVEGWALIYPSVRLNDAPWRGMGAHLFTDLIPGSNTFTMKYKAPAGSAPIATFSNRTLIVVPF